MIQNTHEKKVSHFSVEPIGAYTDLELALDHVTELEEAMPDETENSIFDILEFDLDTRPIFLEFLQIEKEMVQKNLEKAIISLMKDGLVDQLIGEDGNFYYSLTDLGQEEATKIPKSIKKFFKRKKK